MAQQNRSFLTSRFTQLFSCFRRPSHNADVLPSDENEVRERSMTPPGDDQFPVIPPPPPSEILQDKVRYWDIICRRRYVGPRGCFEDNSLFVLYRLYEVIVLDRVIQYRNVLEWFWRQHQWSIKDIPDPQDPDPVRYAFLAGVCYLIVRSFNARVKLGLIRNGWALMGMEEMEELKKVPHEQRAYEKVPPWAENVPALEETYYLPTHEGELLVDKNDKRADPDFLRLNIVLWTPHIFFT